jgi:hypothetical protein
LARPVAEDGGSDWSVCSMVTEKSAKPSDFDFDQIADAEAVIMVQCI